MLLIIGALLSVVVCIIAVIVYVFLRTSKKVIDSVAETDFSELTVVDSKLDE